MDSKNNIGHSADISLTAELPITIYNGNTIMDFKKLKAYPNKPRQYFASLPNFADLKMAARKRATSDITKMANQIARETIAL